MDSVCYESFSAGNSQSLVFICESPDKKGLLSPAHSVHINRQLGWSLWGPLQTCDVTIPSLMPESVYLPHSPCLLLTECKVTSSEMTSFQRWCHGCCSDLPLSHRFTPSSSTTSTPTDTHLCSPGLFTSPCQVFEVITLWAAPFSSPHSHAPPGRLGTSFTHSSISLHSLSLFLLTPSSTLYVSPSWQSDSCFSVSPPSLSLTTLLLPTTLTLSHASPCPSNEMRAYMVPLVLNSNVLSIHMIYILWL